MASLSQDRRGNFFVQLVGLDGVRRTVRIGAMPRRAAERTRDRIANLAAAAYAGQAPEPDDARWLNKIADALRDRLVAIGLARPRAKRTSPTLSTLLDQYVATNREDVDPRTVTAWLQTVRALKAYFGGDREARLIRQNDAEKWRRWLLTEGRLAGVSRPSKSKPKRTKRPLAEATANKRCATARQFFAWAFAARCSSETHSLPRTAHHRPTQSRSRSLRVTGGRLANPRAMPRR